MKMKTSLALLITGLGFLSSNSLLSKINYTSSINSQKDNLNAIYNKAIIEECNQFIEEKKDTPKTNRIKNIDTLEFYKAFYEFGDMVIKEYTRMYDKWISKSIKESELFNEKKIIVDKSEYEIYLLKSGKVINEYPIELGRYPVGDKEKENDMKTPEGCYDIIQKKKGMQTNYYKALLINYPNEEDKKKGKTGSLIEIHGLGSGLPGNNGGSNWTWGCIAVSNSAMDEIYKFADEGDEVIIVGWTTHKLGKD